MSIYFPVLWFVPVTNFMIYVRFSKYAYASASKYFN